nr:nucleotide-binding alpha-beta plait domain-containing protein [Tanacetum cinerariifolium]
MENANPFVPVPPNGLRVKITQELNELRAISTMIDSRLENIDHTRIAIPPTAPFEQLLNDFMNPTDVFEMDDLEFDDKSIDKPLVSPFLDSDDDSKEDDIAKISTSMFVTNFPDSISAKDLFNSCKTYGHVVDSFIPTKTAKNGKRFGFVRFINVFNVDRLVGNLCTVWIDRHKLFANVARFHRNSVNLKTTDPKSQYVGKSDNSVGDTKQHGFKGVNNSYVQALKGQSHLGIPPKVSPSPSHDSSTPALVLDDSCMVSNDLGNYV